ncbi:hypothetical protein MRX96_046297 [Rhipicephalus microplus]
MARSGGEGSGQAHVRREEGQGPRFMVARARSLGGLYTGHSQHKWLRSARQLHVEQRPVTGGGVSPLWKRFSKKGVRSVPA